MADDLALDMNPNDEQEDEEMVHVEVEEEDDRDQYGLNSPKGGGGAMQFGNDDDEEAGSGLALNLSSVGDEDDPTALTPNTKKRDQMDLNSPRAGNQPSNAAAMLVTQVPRDETGGGMITSVSRDDGDDAYETENNLKNVQDSAGFCACFSCLWSCCGGPKQPQKEPIPLQPKNGDKQTYKPNNGKKPADKSTTGLLQSGDGTNTTKDNEESVSSSTEYEVSLLPPLGPEHTGKKCLVLDLDETLVHSSFKPIPKPDFIIPVEIDRVVHHVYVLKRPFVDEFLLRASKCYEIVIFTASLSKYADPLLDKLDIHKVIKHRLFRESCVIHGTAYVKDMRRLGRKLKDSIIVDNSPPSYLFQPTNAVPIQSWFDDQADTQLLDFCPVIETTMMNVPDVRCLLDANNKSFRWLCNQANQPLSKYTVRNDKR